jgi:hypothetical protein
MSLSWSVLALILLGAEDQPPSKPKPPSSTFTVEIEINGPAAAQTESCSQAAPDSADKPGTCAKPRNPGTNRCASNGLAETRVASVAKRLEALTSCEAPPGPKDASLLSTSLPMPLPKVKAPRNLDDAEAPETWPMTLHEATRIALDNSEIVRVIAFGSQGVPIGGFEPTALKTGACVKGCEANAAPIVPVNDSITFQSGLSKRTDTGALIGVVHNVNWSYQNSSFLVFPTAYTTNLQLTLTQPMLGSAPLPGLAADPPVGLVGHRARIVISRLKADASAWRF